MKKIITYGQHNATLQRVKSDASLQLNTIPKNIPFFMPLAELADEIDKIEAFNVISIYPGKGKIVFAVNREVSDNDVIESMCNIISELYDSDTIISNEKAKEVI